MKRRHSLPEEVYTLVEELPASVLLENSSPRAGDPLSRLFAAPLQICAVHRGEEIPALFTALEKAVAAGRFAAGYFSYECGSFFEPTVPARPSTGPLPLAWFGIYDRCFLFDHGQGKFINGEPPQLSEARLRHWEELQPLRIEACLTPAEESYSERIAEIHEKIRAGEIYQLNYTLPTEAQFTGRAARLYEALRARQPVEYGAFLHCEPERKILSFSPELFFDLHLEHGKRLITTRPMKGTAARGRTTQEDRSRAEWLVHDEKNRSENLMIVDLLRNDLGRISRFGTVKAEALFTAERYRSLWQMTSTVSGELRPEVSLQQVFRALFPCGSITGAPKVRAMQLIDELENEPRGVSTGAIGFFSREQSTFNVAIRTLEVQQARAKMGVGSGIVIDSDAAGEYRECLLKADFLLRPARAADEPDREDFSLVETLLWQEGYPLLELHLDRLADSAEYFDFPCDAAAVEAALHDAAKEFTAGSSYKVRLLLNREGELHLEQESLTHGDATGRVVIAAARTDPADRMYFHKTTYRPLYTKALKAAVAAGYDDILFLNQRDQLTEGAISNVIVEKDGHWRTPPQECGLLAGVFRRHLLATRAVLQENTLTLDDLREADAIYLTNAVRGMRMVTVDWEKSEFSFD